ncbi:MAG: hypothetical protein GX751_05265 [Desulfuromonadaceae bacterium]|nr:hypothetical protein [Desulfuromonadaceae bacterium]
MKLKLNIDILVWDMEVNHFSGHFGDVDQASGGNDDMARAGIGIIGITGFIGTFLILDVNVATGIKGTCGSIGAAVKKGAEGHDQQEAE